MQLKFFLMIHNPNHFLTAGKPLDEATKVMVLVHGRGGSAADMLSLSARVNGDAFAFVAPEATNHTWYPHSFLKPLTENEPYLSSALQVLTSLRARLQSDYNVKPSQLYWLGFSQGACLMLEFVARNAMEYGGIFGLSGGLIGPEGTARDYEGGFGNTPVFLGCSDTDPHIPKECVLESGRVFKQMGADVTAKLYPNFPHAINEDELNIVNLLVANDRFP